jgi:ADP-heptose:LPS heptosyltransferase
MATPALDALRRAAPWAEITAVGASPALDLLAGDPRVNARVAIHDFGLDDWLDAGRPSGRRALADWLEVRGFDLVLDTRHAAAAVRGAVRAARLPCRESDPRAEAQALAAGCGAAAAIAAGAAAGWEIDVLPAAAPSLALTAAERATAAEVLRGLDLGGRPAPLAVCPLASHPLEGWPAERFAAVADAAVEDEARPVLLLAGAEPEAAHAVRRAMRHGERARVLPAVGLKVAAAVLERCALLVANDTGVLHLAAAVGLPAVGVFGPTHPNVYRPRHGDCLAVGGLGGCPHRQAARLQPPGCRAPARCLLGEEGCIQAVPTEDVRRAVAERLAALPPARADRTAGLA